MYYKQKVVELLFFLSTFRNLKCMIFKSRYYQSWKLTFWHCLKTISWNSCWIICTYEWKFNFSNFWVAACTGWPKSKHSCMSFIRTILEFAAFSNTFFESFWLFLLLMHLITLYSCTCVYKPQKVRKWANIFEPLHNLGIQFIWLNWGNSKILWNYLCIMNW